MTLSIDKKLFGGFGALFVAFLSLALGAWILSSRMNDRVSEPTSRWLMIAWSSSYWNSMGSSNVTICRATL